jgi:maltose/moltooligosaccharide transporter
MFIQTTTFGFVIKHFLNDDPRNAITFAGVFLLLAASFTLLIKADKPAPDTMISMAAGH